MLRIFAIFLMLLGFAESSLAQAKENRVALVVGNGAYKTAPLRNPTNDAKDMASKLKGLGFTVIERSNLNVKQIGSTLREFRSKLTPGSVALVFYAGHGVQIKGENYLPAVDADIGGEEDVPTILTRAHQQVTGDAAQIDGAFVGMVSPSTVCISGMPATSAIWSCLICV